MHASWTLRHAAHDITELAMTQLHVHVMYLTKCNPIDTTVTKEQSILLCNVSDKI